MNTLSIVIPVYNAINLLPEVLNRIDSIRLPGGLTRQIVIVDDCSTDGTTELLHLLSRNRSDLVIHFHDTNRGKGAALRTGFARATGDIVLVQNADLAYDVRDYNQLLEPLLNGNADVVYGTRFLGQSHRVLKYRHYLGNRLLTISSNMFSNLNLTDIKCGYKLFRREVIKYLKIREDRFGFEPEITAKFAKMKVRIYEAPVRYAPPTAQKDKKITWKDGLSSLWCILRYNLLPGPLPDASRLLARSDKHSAQAASLKIREAA